MKTIVCNSGRITVPKPVRERLRLLRGDILDGEEDAGRIVALIRAKIG